MKTYHVSGHLDLTDAEFAEHYIPLLKTAVDMGAHFVVGDAAGADAKAQAWLTKRTSGCRLDGIYVLVVFHMFENPRNNHGGWPTKGGFNSDYERDAACTAASDDDIAWVRPGRENSGTAKNLARRGESHVDVHKLPPGLYRFGWDSGGSSLVAVGMTQNGARWVAPTNWLAPQVPWIDPIGNVLRADRIDPDKP